MNSNDFCDSVLLVQADHDGELDAAQAAALAAHIVDCRICSAAGETLQSVRRTLHSASYHRAPAALRERISLQVAVGSRIPSTQLAIPASTARDFPWWRQTLAGFGAGAAVAASLLLILLSPSQQALDEQVVAGHVRSLQPGHLEDIVSTDQHNVKPWFEGRVDFAPPVKDLAGSGFPLEGGRLDYLDRRTVAALVYGHGKHPINMFVWPAGPTAGHAETATEHNGYNVVHWQNDGMAFWVVSDLNMAELQTFVRAWRDSP